MGWILDFFGGRLPSQKRSVLQAPHSGTQPPKTIPTAAKGEKPKRYQVLVTSPEKVKQEAERKLIEAEHNPAANTHCYLLVDGNRRGPFLPAQIRSMWNAGTITADTQFIHSDLPDWRPVSSFCENVPPSVAPDNALEVLQLQSKMKSKAVAALLAVFLPFVGALYSAPGAAIICGIIGLVTLCLGISDLSDPNPNSGLAVGFWLILATVSYIVSIFRAIAGVDRFNQGLLTRKPSRVS